MGVGLVAGPCEPQCSWGCMSEAFATHDNQLCSPENHDFEIEPCCSCPERSAYPFCFVAGKSHLESMLHTCGTHSDQRTRCYVCSLVLGKYAVCALAESPKLLFCSRANAIAVGPFLMENHGMQRCTWARLNVVIGQSGLEDAVLFATTSSLHKAIEVSAPCSPAPAVASTQYILNAHTPIQCTLTWIAVRSGSGQNISLKKSSAAYAWLAWKLRDIRTVRLFVCFASQLCFHTHSCE